MADTDPTTTILPAAPAPTALVPTSEVKKGDHVFLVDGSSYIFRAYHALPPLNRKSDGLQLNAVFGFCNMLWKLLRDMKPEERPTHLAVVFDKSEKTFRTDMYPDYKAHRPDPPDDLIPQFSLIRDAVRAFDLPSLEQDGFEADDLIATYTRQACEAGASATIVSSDKDLMQLVNDCVVLYDTMRDNRIGIAGVVEKFGVTPDKMIDLQALIGDSVDNVPGVAGVGPKAASSLINELGSLDSILSADAPTLEARLGETLAKVQKELDALANEPVKAGSAVQVTRLLSSRFGVRDLPLDKKGNPSADAETIEKLARAGNEFCKLLLRARSVSRVMGGTLKKIFDAREQVAISKHLVTLDLNVSLRVPLAELAVHEPDYKRLIAFLKAMEFSSLTKRVAEFAKIESSGIEPDTSFRAGSKRAGGKADKELTLFSAQEASQGASQGTLPGTSQGNGTPATKSRAGEPKPQAEINPQLLASARLEASHNSKVDRSLYQTVRTLEELNSWIARAQSIGIVALGTRTTSPDPMQGTLCGVSLAVAPNEACYLPLAHREGGDGTSGGLFAGAIAGNQIPEPTALAALKPLLEDTSILKVGHDLKSDLQVLARHGIMVASCDDIMLMSYVLDAGRSDHGLDHLSKHYLDHAIIEADKITGTGKSKVTFDCVPQDIATEAAAESADMVLRLWRVLKPRLVAEHISTVYATLERPMLAVLARMERHGIAIDRQVLSRLSGDFAQRAAGLEAEIQELAGEPLNPGSPKQIGDILFGKLSLPGGTKTRTGQWATGARALEDLAEQGVGSSRVDLQACKLEYSIVSPK